jgi:heme-degrading monooxygenase HmoA
VSPVTIAVTKGANMFARTSTWSGSPEALQDWADNAASKVKAFVEGLPGNAGAVFLVDRDGGTALTLTLWDSDDAARATDQFAEQSRAATVAATGTELVARGSYEVVARS